MALGTLGNNYRKGFISQISGDGFNPDSAFGANMTLRSNLLNPNPSRDTQNALIGASQNQGGSAFEGGSGAGNTGYFSSLFDPEKMKTSLLTTAASIGDNLIGRLIGGDTGRTYSQVANTAGQVGSAAAQGFANPLSDASAAMSLVNLFRRFM